VSKKYPETFLLTQSLVGSLAPRADRKWGAKRESVVVAVRATNRPSSAILHR